MKNWTPLMCVYLLFSIVGAILPGYYIILHLIETKGSFTIAEFISSGMANLLSSAITLDLFIGAGCFLLWIIIEGHRMRMKNLWFYFVFTFTISFAFAGPLFLFMRERKLRMKKLI